MFALTVILCAGIAGAPSETCNQEYIDGPFQTMQECAIEMSKIAERDHVADYQCSRLVKDKHVWGKDR